MAWIGNIEESPVVWYARGLAIRCAYVIHERCPAVRYIARYGAPKRWRVRPRIRKD